jgi:hypothetical protein
MKTTPQITGTPIESMNLQAGKDKNGKAWRKEDYLIRYGNEKYPKHVILVAWNDMITEMHFAMGVESTFQIEPVSHKSDNGIYFTNIKVWRIDN